MKSTGKIICIVPARGGSKRIPKKNIKNFLGKPIISYPITAARESRLFDEVMVSTDDDEIGRISRKYGAVTPFLRSQSNSDDSASLTDVLLEVVKDYQKQGSFFDIVCCLLPTACLVTVEHLVAVHTMIQNDLYDSVFPIVEFDYPLQRSLVINGDFVQMKDPRNLFIRTQDCEASYHDAGQFYFVRTDSLLEKKSLLTDKSGYVLLEPYAAQDIDTENDWFLAETKYRMLQERRPENQS